MMCRTRRDRQTRYVVTAVVGVLLAVAVACWPVQVTAYGVPAGCGLPFRAAVATAGSPAGAEQAGLVEQCRERSYGRLFLASVILLVAVINGAGVAAVAIDRRL